MTTDSPTPALTTVDQQTPTTEARPLGPAAQPRRPATSRRVFAWTATISTLGVGAVLAVTALAQDHTDAPSINHGARETTELDVSGIPIWWTDAPSITADALAHDEHIRDRLSIPLFDTVDRIASNVWDDDQIGDLLRQLSSSMADEVDTLAALDLEAAR